MSAEIEPARARRAAARLLRDSRLSRTPFPGFPPELRPQGEGDGYAVQSELNAILAADLGPVVGYKVGCTTPQVQAFMNIANPCFGAIYAKTVFPSGSEILLSGYVRAGVECEIGVRLGSDLDPRKSTIDRESAARAIAACFTSIEIVDERYADFRAVGTPTLIADDFMDAGIVRGPERTGIDALALDRARGATIADGKTIGSGAGADVLGHPLEALVWLAHAMAARGRVLRAGEIVSTGSMVPPYFPNAGEKVTIANDMLGDVTITIR